jgi:hypothetical protein
MILAQLLIQKHMKIKINSTQQFKLYEKQLFCNQLS